MLSGEVDNLLIVAGHAVHTTRGTMQPVLHEQEPLVIQAEGPLLPLRAGEAVVLRRRLDGGWRARHEAGTCGIEGEPHGLAERLGNQVPLLARGEPEVQKPVKVGEQKPVRERAPLSVPT